MDNEFYYDKDKDDFVDKDDAACLSRQVECVLLSQVVDVHLAEAA